MGTEIEEFVFGAVLGFWAGSTLLWAVLGRLGPVPKVLRRSGSVFGVFVT